MVIFRPKKSTVKSTNKSTTIFHTIIHEQFPFGGSHTGLPWWVLWSGHLLDRAVGVSLAAACAAGGRARLRGCLCLNLFRWSSGSGVGCDVTNLSGVVDGGVGGPGGRGRCCLFSGLREESWLRAGSWSSRPQARSYHASYRCQKVIGFIQQLRNDRLHQATNEFE